MAAIVCLTGAAASVDRHGRDQWRPANIGLRESRGNQPRRSLKQRNRKASQTGIA